MNGDPLVKLKVYFHPKSKSRKVTLTAQFGSNASIVGERPRYKPFIPSVFTMFCRLVIMMLPVVNQTKENTSSNEGIKEYHLLTLTIKVQMLLSSS